MQQHNPIITCCRCTRRFRPASPSIIVCHICLQVFATTGNAPGDPVPVVESLRPPKPENIEETRKREARITDYGVPRGICAHQMCRRPFTPRYNQRYCSDTCRVRALTDRRRILYGRT